MNLKLYFGTLFLICICFGAIQEQVSIPNQEIVLEFVDAKIGKNDIKITIAEVKEKLLKVGVSKIHIQETENGTLKISYYSVIHVNNIKEILLNKESLILNKNSENKENNHHSFSYNIDVYEISDKINIADLDDKYLVEIKINSERFTTNFNHASLRTLEVFKANQRFTIAYKASKSNPFTKDNTSYKEPEVRAGPYYICA